MTWPRLLFVAMPPPEVVSAMQRVVTRHQLEARLGDALFPATNWHQSLSDRYEDEPALRKKLLRAGASLSAEAFTLTLNRLRDQARGGPIHRAFRARGKPRGLTDLLAAVRRALSTEGLDGGPGHTPHLTLSYWAPERLGPIEMAPIHWTIDAVLLVAGGGSPYHYETIGRWALRPKPARQQLSLF